MRDRNASGTAPKGVKARRGELLRIGRYLLPSLGASLPLLACIVSGAALGLVPPYVMHVIIDTAIPQHNGTLLNWLIAAMIGAPLIASVIGLWQNHLVTVMTQSVLFDLHNEMYGKLLQQSTRFFTDTKSGEMLSRLQNDIGGVEGGVGGAMVSLAINVFTLLTTLVLIFRIDWQLSLAAVAIAPLFFIPAHKVGQIHQKLSKETQERIAELTAYAQETLSVGGSLTTRLFGARPYEAQRYRDKAAMVRDLKIQKNNVGRWFFVFQMFLMTVGPALIYLVGGYAAIAGRLTIGTIVMFVAYFHRMYGPATALANMHVEIMSARSFFRRIFEYLDLPVEIAEPAAPVRIAHPVGVLRFDRVSMGYMPGVPTVMDISFEVRPGQMVALVGPSGAGKTTLAYLACRLYDPSEGRVTFDGVDIRELALADLSNWVANVTQEATLFNATVEENLRYGKPDATHLELEDACRRAQIDQVIAALPDGYRTMVGERGYRLSGGEKQRIALARAILRDPKVLILDEATASLDARSELLIQQALDPLLAGRTSLVIAHRASTILRADLILVLDGGRIVERGTHAELLAQGGLYATLYEEQFQTNGAAATQGRP